LLKTFSSSSYPLIGQFGHDVWDAWNRGVSLQYLYVSVSVSNRASLDSHF